MIVAGYQKVTLQDYPDNVGAICFTKGCNLRCPFCHNPDLVLSKDGTDKTDEFLEYVKNRSSMLDGVVISGGEPLIHDDIYDFISKIKSLGLKVKLDTNGMFPKRLSKLLRDGLIDYVALDYKGSEKTLGVATGVSSIFGLKLVQSIKEIKAHNVEYEVRTTIVKGIHTKSDVLLMADELSEIGGGVIPKWFLQKYEEKKAILGTFTEKDLKISAFSDEEMLEILESVSSTIRGARLR